jgi:RHS repeat-associated protein
MAATNLAGTAIWKEDYRPFGERQQNEAAASSQHQWFGGKPQDSETGLSYFGARYYDPVMGRFMGVDSVGFSEGNLHSFNRYAYANNNPYKFRDPDGRFAIVEGFLIGIGVVGTVGYAVATTEQRNQFGQSVIDGFRGVRDKLNGMFASSETAKPKKDGEGSSPEEIANSKGGPTAGQRVNPEERQKILDRDQQQDGSWICWRCGTKLWDPKDVHIGHKNVPRSQGGNKTDDNLACEGAACNQSAGARGEVKEGSGCAAGANCSGQ